MPGHRQRLNFLWPTHLISKAVIRPTCITYVSLMNSSYSPRNADFLFLWCFHFLFLETASPVQSLSLTLNAAPPPSSYLPAGSTSGIHSHLVLFPLCSIAQSQFKSFLMAMGMPSTYYPVGFLILSPLWSLLHRLFLWRTIQITIVLCSQALALLKGFRD